MRSSPRWTTSTARTRISNSPISSESALNYLQQILDEIRIGEDDKKAFDDCMERLEQAKRARRITEIGDILSMADPDTDPVYIKQLTEELVTLNQMNKR